MTAVQHSSEGLTELLLMALYYILLLSPPDSNINLVYLYQGGKFGAKNRVFSKNIAVSAPTELQRRRAGQRAVVQGDGRGQGDGQLLHLQTGRAGERQEADQAPTTGNQRSGQSDTVNGGKMIYVWWGTKLYREGGKR